MAGGKVWRTFCEEADGVGFLFMIRSPGKVRSLDRGVQLPSYRITGLPDPYPLSPSYRILIIIM